MDYYELEHAERVVNAWNKLSSIFYDNIVADPDNANWKEVLKDILHDGSREVANILTYTQFRRERDLIYNRHVNMAMHYLQLLEFIMELDRRVL